MEVVINMKLDVDGTFYDIVVERKSGNRNTYIRVKDPEKKKHVKRIKAISDILDYSQSSRPQQIRKVYKLVGFAGVTAMLTVLDKIK